MQHGSTYNASLPFKELLEKWEVPPINEVTRKLERVNRAMKKQTDELEKTKWAHGTPQPSQYLVKSNHRGNFLLLLQSSQNVNVWCIQSFSLVRYRHDVMEALHSLEKCVRELKDGFQQSAHTWCSVVFALLVFNSLYTHTVHVVQHIYSHFAHMATLRSLTVSFDLLVGVDPYTVY